MNKIIKKWVTVAVLAVLVPITMIFPFAVISLAAAVTYRLFQMWSSLLGC